MGEGTLKAGMGALAAALGIVLACGPASAQTAPQPMTAESMWDLARVGAPAISPDGRSVAYAVSRIAADNDTPNVNLYLAPTDGGPARQLTTDPAAEGSPIWSPDGGRIAFVAKRAGDEAGQLYVMSLTGGEARRVTNVPTGVLQPQWMPDGSGVAFVSRIWEDIEGWEAQGARLKARKDSSMTAQVWDQAPISYWDSWIDDRTWHLFVADIESGDVRQVTTADGPAIHFQQPGGDPFDIAPDGREFAIVSDTDTTGVRGNLDVYLIDAATGAARNVTASNPADDDSPLYSPDGRYLAFAQQRIYGFYADKARLMLLDRRTGTARELGESFDRSASGFLWAPDSRSLYGAIDDASVRRVHRYDVASGAVRRITDGMDVDSLAIAARGGVLVGLRQSLSAPAHLVRINTRNGAMTPLADPNTQALAGLAMGRVESVTYAGANGAPIQMWVVYPPGFDPTKKYPLMLLLHGGPHNAVTNAWTWRWNAQVFAGWGYVVAWHNFHGSSGFGQDFTDSINPNRSDLPYQDTIAAADWFAAQPWIDSERMAAGGGSYGGYLASVLLGREHPFRTLVAHAAVYNSYTQIAADYGAGVDRFFQYWEDPAQWQATSPHMAAANFNTPTLVIHGQLDYRVPVNHGIELFNTLQTRGVPSRLIYYPNENHWILKRQNSQFWYAQVRDWIARYAPPGADAAPVAAWAPPQSAAAGATGRQSALPLAD